MLELKYVNPSNLHDAWELIQDGLEVCIKQDDEHPLKEDVYTAIRMGNSHLHLGYESGKYVGFIILTPFNAPYTGLMTLHVWFAYKDGGMHLTPEGQREIEKIARHMNASRITFRTPKAAFERLAPNLGYEISQVQWVKYL